MAVEALGNAEAETEELAQRETWESEARLTRGNSVRTSFGEPDWLRHGWDILRASASNLIAEAQNLAAAEPPNVPPVSPEPSEEEEGGRVSPPSESSEKIEPPEDEKARLSEAEPATPPAAPAALAPPLTPPAPEPPPPPTQASLATLAAVVSAARQLQPKPRAPQKKLPPLPPDLPLDSASIVLKEDRNGRVQLLSWSYKQCDGTSATLDQCQQMWEKHTLTRYMLTHENKSSRRGRGPDGAAHTVDAPGEHVEQAFARPASVTDQPRIAPIASRS